MDKLVEYAPTALALLGALIGLLAVVAPLTKSSLDNRALEALRKVADFVGKLVGARAPAAPAPKP
jgi:hypothetical protein